METEKKNKKSRLEKLLSKTCNLVKKIGGNNSDILKIHRYFLEYWVKENNIKVGDMVLVQKEFYEGDNCVDWGMDISSHNTIGKSFRIVELHKDSVELSYGNHYPFFVLEKVKEEEEKEDADEKQMIPLNFNWILDIQNKWMTDTRTDEKCYIRDYSPDRCTPDCLLCVYEKRWAWVSFEDLQNYFVGYSQQRFEREG